jgi:3D (Asp-Asp-Asp) domain-containing protein
MQDDLVNPTTTLSRLARRTVVLFSLILAIGLTGVAFARAEQQRPRIAWVGRSLVVVPQPAEMQRLMEVTAYCPCPKCCGPDAQGITASGRTVDYNDGRFVAADRSLPFGTRISIPGYGDGQPVEVIDRGGAIKGDKLDVFFPTHDQALQWGRQKLLVTVQN